MASTNNNWLIQIHGLAMLITVLGIEASDPQTGTGNGLAKGTSGSTGVKHSSGGADHIETEWTDPFTYRNGSRKMPPDDFMDGPMPTISDSLFSLIILVYVLVIFVFVFFSFCWKEPQPPPPNPAHKNIPMITTMLDEMEKAEAEAKKSIEVRHKQGLVYTLCNGLFTFFQGEETEMKELNSKEAEENEANGDQSEVNEPDSSTNVNVISETSNGKSNVNKSSATSSNNNKSDTPAQV